MNPQSTRGGIRMVLVGFVLVGLAVAAIWYGFIRDPSSGQADVPLSAPLARGPLRVTVMESGSLEAVEFHNITNAVEGRTTIDHIVDEGTIITPEDVTAGLVLVRLNKADIEEKRLRQEIEVAAAIDSHANAVTNLEIQLQQNASDLRKADLDVRFARLDLERYVGKAFAERLLGAYVKPTPVNGEGSPANGGGGTAVGLDAAVLRRLIGSLLESEDLEGEARQRIRELNSDIFLSDEQHRRAAEKVRHSERLEGKGYVSKEELEADRLALKQREVDQQRARTANEQYVAYDFPKEVVKLLSGVVEAEDRLSRAYKRAQAEEAQKRSAVKSRQQQAELKQRRLKDFVTQEAACEIRATMPGLVVYASSGKERRWGDNERIREGASVRQGQTLIQIPQAGSLGARISVHETVIDRVKEGLEAWIVVDAITGNRLPGRVASVARLPNPADRWLNPDLKVYTTIIELEGEHPTLKPGMSAQVEILITELADVLAVPVQAVAGTMDEPAVWVWQDGQLVRRQVVLGLASDHFVQIESGVNAGERVLLDPPRETHSGRNRSAANGPAARSPNKQPAAGRPESGRRPEGSERPKGGEAPKGRPGRGGEKRPGKPGGGKGRPERGSGSR